MSKDQIILITIFAVVYIATIWPSWKLLARLLARSASSHKLSGGFWVELFVYRLLIAAPYIILLVAGKDVLPELLRSFIIGVIFFSLVFSLVRIFLRNNIVEWLWIIYGYTYDGLLHFSPYRKLLDVVASKVNQRSRGGSVLELGSGTGNMLQSIRRLLPEVNITGVDMSPTMTAIARKKLASDSKVTLFKDDALAYLIKQKSKSVDVIVMQNSLYAIDNRHDLWKQLRRVIADNGSIIISNSDRAGSKSIIDEHLKSDSFIKLFHPKLLLVGLIDMFISQFSQTGVFSFLTKEQIEQETRTYFTMSTTERVYGDVNILFILTPR